MQSQANHSDSACGSKQLSMFKLVLRFPIASYFCIIRACNNCMVWWIVIFGLAIYNDSIEAHSCVSWYNMNLMSNTAASYSNGCRMFWAVALCHPVAVDKSHGSKCPAPIWIRSCSIAHQIHVVHYIYYSQKCESIGESHEHIARLIYILRMHNQSPAHTHALTMLLARAILHVFCSASRKCTKWWWSKLMLGGARLMTLLWNFLDEAGILTQTMYVPCMHWLLCNVKSVCNVCNYNSLDEHIYAHARGRGCYIIMYY